MSKRYIEFAIESGKVSDFTIIVQKDLKPKLAKRVVGEFGTSKLPAAISIVFSCFGGLKIRLITKDYSMITVTLKEDTKESFTSLMHLLNLNIRDFYISVNLKGHQEIKKINEYSPWKLYYDNSRLIANKIILDTKELALLNNHDVTGSVSLSDDLSYAKSAEWLLRIIKEFRVVV